MSMLVLIVVGFALYGLGIFTGVYIGMSMAKEFSTRSYTPRTPRKADSDAIMQLLAQQGEITNNDVETLLAVSDATATRYLDHMETAGLIVQKGKTGRSVYYTAVK